MYDILFKQGFAPIIVGALIGGLATYHLLYSPIPPLGLNQTEPVQEDYHTHADFHIVINNELLDLNEEMYMSSALQLLHEDTHLHDGEGDVQHIHAEGITFAEFINSLGLKLTDSCLTTDTGEQYCSGETEEVLLYVNGEPYPEPLSTYTPQDEDRVLLYYGEATNPAIEAYLEAVPNDACYYSGTCPERGVAPAESCGLTCEL